jgi:hypothetical protein
MMMLTDTQAVILSLACQRPRRLVLPLPARLRGGAVVKVIQSLTAKQLIEEVAAQPGEPVWRETGDGHSTTLTATDAGLMAIGIEPDGADAPDESAAPDTATKGATADAHPGDDALARGTAGNGAEPKERKVRAGTKQAMLIEILRAPEGATIEEIVVATGWQPHTVRGAMAGALKKKLGLEVTSEKVEGRGRVYSLPSA